MPLQSNITHERDFEAAALPPFILEKADWVGKDNRHNWCWTACAAMVLRYNDENLRKLDIKNLLCSKIANRAVKQGRRLVATEGDCCVAGRCNKTLSEGEVSDLWESLLGHRPTLAEPSDFLSSNALVSAITDELQTNRGLVEVGLSGRPGHLIIVYGFGEANGEKVFYVHDPDMPPKSFIGPYRSIAASSLISMCIFLWFNLK